VQVAGRKKRVNPQHLAEASDVETASSHDPSFIDLMPESDTAYPIISTILDVVPASHWTFAHVGSYGELVLVFGSPANGRRLAELVDELRRQRQKATTGSRIAATLGSLGNFASGITLLFADARADFGILTLLRTAEMGPFTSSEVVLDSELRIVLAWNAEDQRRIALTGLQTQIAERLPSVLEESVRALTAGWSSDSVNQPGISRPVPFLVVRTQPMSGPAGLLIGVRIDRFREPNSLISAADRFHISPREVQVLALLLDGNHLNQIAEQLYITSSTVQDHIKSMLDKTESSNRSELIARVLGWESTPSASQA
jgi:DNA-binding CsgD family transcriptional regulator